MISIPRRNHAHTQLDTLFGSISGIGSETPPHNCAKCDRENCWTLYLYTYELEEQRIACWGVITDQETCLTNK
jgi:hypothetical protein